MGKKTITAVLLEAALIFVSILLAFWTENFRQNRLEKENYIKTLVLFRNELHENIRRFGATYDSSLSKFTRGKALPALIQQRKQLEFIDSLFYDSNHNNDLIALDSLAYMPNWLQWRNRTTLIEQLYNFPGFAQEDSIFFIGSQFKYIMDNEFVMYEEFNKSIEAKENLFLQNSDLNKYLKNGNAEFNGMLTDRLLMRSMRNNNSYLWLSTGKCIWSDSTSATQLRKLTKKLDRLLLRHGVETNNLDKRYLIASP